MSRPAEFALIRLQHVSKHYQVDKHELEVLREIKLDINEGECVAIVGASGCGKSTLLRLMLGLDRHYQGQIHIDNMPVIAVREDCSLVFQEHRLFPWLSVERNVELGLAASKLGLSEKRQRIAAHIRLVGLAGFERALPHQLSGGMAQRAAIARGLVSQPRILLLDEPFGALDALTRRQLQDELIAIRQRRQLTTVLVTHDVEEAILLADRIVIMGPRPGRILRQLQVALPHPRQRADPSLQALREEILSELVSPVPR